MYKKILLIISIAFLISCSGVEYMGNSGTDQGISNAHKVRFDGTDYYRLFGPEETKKPVVTKTNTKTTPVATTSASTTSTSVQTSTKTPVTTTSTSTKPTTTTTTKPTTTSTSSSNTGTSDYKKPDTNDTKDYLFPVRNISVKKAYKEGSYSGIDFNVPKNTDIYSVAPGMVIFADEKASLGKALFIYHNNGYVSIYTNLERLNYKKGDYVNSSKDIIARASGSFGFEFRKRTQDGTIPLDPNKYLRKR